MGELIGPHSGRGEIAAELSRRELVERGSTLGLAALVASAFPLATGLAVPERASAAGPPTDAVLQAFADTVIPGRTASKTDLGDAIHPEAIAGVDPEPGAVEADALRLLDDATLGTSALVVPLVAELEARSLSLGGNFVALGYEDRVAVVGAGLDFTAPERTLFEAMAGVVFVAFCAAGTQIEPTDRTASGYRVMGLPGAAPRGYRSFSYRRRLARERTRSGSLD